MVSLTEFQSTPPARGATYIAEGYHVFAVFQSTPPARGATRLRTHQHDGRLVSIHAPRAGGDSPHAVQT